MLEFGCGEFSTKLFLDSRRFPDLEYLESYENDSAWAERVRQQLGSDSRLNLRFVDGRVAEVVKGLNHRYRFTGVNPNIGMVWNGAQVSTRSLRILDRTLRRNTHAAEVTDWSNSQSVDVTAGKGSIAMSRDGTIGTVDFQVK